MCKEDCWNGLRKYEISNVYHRHHVSDISDVFSIIVSMSGVLPLGYHTDGDMAAFQLNYIPVLTSDHFKISSIFGNGLNL